MKQGPTPAPVAAARARAREAGFERSCDDRVGRLLATLAAAVPEGGRILEIGTGAGVGLAWLMAGLGPCEDVEVVSIEANPRTHALAAAAGWPGCVRLIAADALRTLGGLGTFDLIFADAEGGKITGLDLTLAALAPAGILVVDDMAERPDDPYHASLFPRLREVAATLRRHPDLITTELDWAGGVIVSARRR